MKTLLSKRKKDALSAPLAHSDEMSADSMASTGDRLGMYPSKVDVPVLEGRRYLWTARAFAVGFYISMALNIVLASVIYNLSPLKRVEPMLVTFTEKNDQIVRIEPFEKGTQGFDLMVEALSREYVLAREEIIKNADLMRDRWGRLVRYRSGDAEYERFMKAKQPVLVEAQSRGLSRQIKVTAVNKFSQNSVRVEFSSIDLDDKDQKIQEVPYEVILRFAFQPQKVNFEDRYINPLGFTVLEYSLRRKEG